MNKYRWLFNGEAEIRRAENLQANSLDPAEPISKMAAWHTDTLLVAAGPSLPREIDIENKYVICSSRAWRCLAYRGISPDMVVHIDPWELCDGFFDGVAEKTMPEDYPILVFSRDCCPVLAAKFRGRKYWVENYCERIFDRPATATELPYAGHVGGLMLSLAYALGSAGTQIECLGYDYNFPGMHVKHSTFGEGMLCLQYYAQPYLGMSFDPAGKGEKFEQYQPWLCKEFRLCFNTYPYPDPTNPNCLTTDILRAHKLNLTEVFRHFKVTELPKGLENKGITP